MTLYGNDNHNLFWDVVSGEHEAVQKRASFVHAKVAASQYWPFLARAVDENDFENRLSITQERIAALVGTELANDVLSSFRDDYRLVTAKGENPFAKDDDEDNDEADDDDKDSKKSKKSDDDSDDDDESDDDSDDDKKSKSKKSDSDDDSDDDDSDDKSKSFDHSKPDFLKGKQSAKGKQNENETREICPNCEHPINPGTMHKRNGKGVCSTVSKEATNYQPDPNAAWRYHPGYEQLRQPVNNGDLQDSDGFVQDLAQGEGRSNPVIEQRQLTPGTWTEHDSMPERPMPFSEQNYGYRPVNASFDKEGYLVVEANQYIKQQGGKWVILQKGTGKVLSHHDSEEQAKESFAAMEMHKHEGSLRFDRDGFLVEASDGNKSTDDFYNYNNTSHDRDNGVVRGKLCPDCHGSGGSERRCNTCNGRGTLKVAAEGRGVDPIQDPVPGAPQKHNPFYFQEGNAMGSNEGFPTDPSAEPHLGPIDEIYGEVAPVSSSGSSEGQVDGDGYSRLTSASSLRYDADGYLVESPNFI